MSDTEVPVLIGGIEPSGCVLVRPDGFIAWRPRTSEPPSAARLNAVLAKLVGGGKATTQ